MWKGLPIKFKILKKRSQPCNENERWKILFRYFEPLNYTCLDSPSARAPVYQIWWLAGASHGFSSGGRIVGRWLTYTQNTLKIEVTGFGILHSRFWKGRPLLNLSLEGTRPLCPLLSTPMGSRSKGVWAIGGIRLKGHVPGDTCPLADVHPWHSSHIRLLVMNCSAVMFLIASVVKNVKNRKSKILVPFSPLI